MGDRKEFLEIIVVVSAVFLVYLVSGGIHCVEGVHAYASLKTASRLPVSYTHLDVYKRQGGLPGVPSRL